MRYLIVAASISAIIFAASNFAIAGPPFVTDDPEPVEYQQWEVNYGVSETRTEDETVAGIPSLDINYGYSTDIQVHIQPRYTFVKGDTDSVSHFDNTEVGVKYRFMNYRHDNGTFMAGIYPMIQLPTGDNTLGATSGKTQVFLPLWLQESTEKWTFYGGSGYRINRSIESKNSCFTGLVSLYHFTPALQLGGEIFHETAVSSSESGSSGFNLGGIYNVSAAQQVLFSTGKALGNDSQNEFSIYMAFHVLY